MCRGRRPGCAPGGAVTFFCFAKRKSPKKRRPYCPCPLRFAPGQPAMLPQGVCRGTHCAPTALRSDNHAKLDHEACVSFGTHAHPLRCASRHGQKGTHRTAKRAIAALGLALAARSACAPSGRAQRWPVRFAAFNPLLAAPAAGRLRDEHARRSAHASSSDSPRLSERSAPARSELRGAPRKRTDAGLPLRSAKGSQTVGRVSLPPFLSRDKKGGRPPGRDPASALNRPTRRL